MTPAIRIENLSKKYVLRHQQQVPYVALRDALTGAVKRLGRALRHPFGGHDSDDKRFEEFWALNDVSFNVQPGERVGIIGRNGAGKSTLLKILSRITAPTTGRVTLHGRVASLLEVGTGFHPELTGRENIFLNGAILGMRKAETLRKFDAIVDFAEVEKFLDTPVKRYSSGMYVRLAFAVAAHLETDILVVDEVLAVGDANFQKKCMGKMESVSQSGRTVLFVSHNMGAVAELCDRAVLLHQGQLVQDGRPTEVIERYMAQVASGSYRIEANPVFPIFVTEIILRDAKGTVTSSIPLGEDGELEIHYHVDKPLKNVVIAMMLTRYGTPLLYSYDNDTHDEMGGSRDPGDYKTTLKIPLSKFKEGQYSAEIRIGVGQTNMSDDSASIMFEICNNLIDTTHCSYRIDRPGHLYWPLYWNTDKIL